MTEAFISVDIETSGPAPSRHVLLAIGACVVADPGHTFYAELQPDGEEADAEALAVSGLSLERLAADGTPPEQAMERFAAWIEGVVEPGSRPVFVALNAPFDWMFVADYFHRFLGRNPFGHSALDVKALFMGRTGTAWSETSLHHIARRYRLDAALPHHALEDAILQAELFRHIINEGGGSA